ncbi:unnamed protein product [Linum tenue]|uniref:Uncharacterized protein n=1 Tax=Linum tenue TaxID=586396 RepID=A0AAV0NZ71_9ROSI|nr:unnamed protein product [Linum tenue]
MMIMLANFVKRNLAFGSCIIIIIMLSVVGINAVEAGNLQGAIFLNVIVKVYCSHLTPGYSPLWQNKGNLQVPGSEVQRTSYAISFTSTTCFVCILFSPFIDKL